MTQLLARLREADKAGDSLPTDLSWAEAHLVIELVRDVDGYVSVDAEMEEGILSAVDRPDGVLLGGGETRV